MAEFASADAEAELAPAAESRLDCGAVLLVTLGSSLRWSEFVSVVVVELLAAVEAAGDLECLLL